MQAALVTRIMVMGWAYRDDTSISLAQGMKHYLIANHKLPDDETIITNEASRDTVGDAFFSRQIYDMQAQESEPEASDCGDNQ